MSYKPHVHIVDDDNAVREALYFLMQSEQIPAKTYATAEEFIEKHDNNSGCLLLDMRMPGMSGMELLKVLKNRSIDIPIIFITGHGDVAMAVEAMRFGATDFIEKPFDNDYLLMRVRKCLTKSIDNYKRSEILQEKQERLARLTKRERQVMDLLVEGKQNKVIASELGISPRTVELHRAKVMDKLSAESLSDVVRLALSMSDQN